ncbi:hypothetical protein GCM10010330_78000 [Streptomyces tendae]|nr:hypothetical protein GCM10010330_78000 [Streptomyces tendae]
MVIILAVLALVVVNALAESPWGTFSVTMTIPIALFMGFYMRYLRPGRVLETSLIGVALLLLAIVGGGWVENSSLAGAFTWAPTTLVFCLIAYGFVASVLPVWMLLAPRDYLSTFMKVGTIVLLAIGVVFSAPLLKNDAVSQFASTGTGPVFAGALFPFPTRVGRFMLQDMLGNVWKPIARVSWKPLLLTGAPSGACGLRPRAPDGACAAHTRRL